MPFVDRVVLQSLGNSKLVRNVHSRALCEKMSDDHEWRHHGVAGNFSSKHGGEWSWETLMHESLEKEKALSSDGRGLFLARLSEQVSTQARNEWLARIGEKASFGDYLPCGSSEYLYLHAT